MSLLDLFRRKSAPPRPARKSDGWTNPVAGFGVLGRDKLHAGYFTPDVPIDPTTLAAIYYGDTLAAKIVDKLISEAFRKGYNVSADDTEAAKALEKSAAKLDFNSKFQEALRWGRLFGGSLLIFGAQDGSASLAEPLNEKRISSVPWLYVVDRRFATPHKYYQELGPKFGKPETYLITAQGSTTSQMFEVHESRCLRFGGVEVDAQRRRELSGWDQSLLQRPYEIIRQFATAMQGVGIMLADANQGVFKIQGLIQALSSNQGEALKERLQMLDYGRSIARSAVLDATEDFGKVASTFSGIPESVDRLMQHVAASVDMPVSLLFGRSAAGMNATGDLDLDGWHATVNAFQGNDLGPLLIRGLEILSLAKDSPAKGKIPTGLGVTWAPLRMPSFKETAEVRKIHVETMAIACTASILDPAQAAISTFGKGGGEWSFDAPQIDIDLLESELKARQTFEDPDEQGEDPPPVQEGQEDGPA